MKAEKTALQLTKEKLAEKKTSKKDVSKIVEAAKTGAVVPEPTEEVCENFLFELKSWNMGKVHAVVAKDEAEARLIVAQDVTNVKYLPKIKAHMEVCEKCSVVGEEMLVHRSVTDQVSIYNGRSIRKVMPSSEPAGLIGRNVDPIPLPEQMN